MVMSVLLPGQHARRPAKARHRSSQPLDAPKAGSPTTEEVSMGDDVQPRSEDNQIKSLNDALLHLAAIFPDIQAEVFREMLISFDEESRLHVVTETLLKHKAKWVQGRWRIPKKDKGHQRVYRVRTDMDRADETGTLAVEDRFRSEAYKRASRATLYQEFRGLSKSTIDAVLAEHNYSYTLARPTLLTVSSKSWRFALSSFFLRRKAPLSLTPSKHPLIFYHPTSPQGEGSPIPTLKYTESAELNQELFETLLAPLQRTAREERDYGDYLLAIQLNDAEAEAYGALHDCQCCFTPTSFEQLSACDHGGHLVCHRCLRHTIHESLFGQGWGRNIQHDKGLLRCLAPMLDEDGDCAGCMTQSLIRIALLEEKGGEEIWSKFEERLADEVLLKSGISLVRCPFCIYAEADDTSLPPVRRPWVLRRHIQSSIWLFLILVLATGVIALLMPFVVLYLILEAAVPSLHFLRVKFADLLAFSLVRVRRKRRGLRFICRNPLCGRASCLSCSKEWVDIHVCFESERTALRAAVESAMAEAVKRTCPRCNVSFVKASGCNKLTCVCGYTMCYICRANIGKDSYRHFCEHFRPDPGKNCTECEKCDLYKCEDEEVVVRKAAERAEREWKEKEGIESASKWETKGKVAGHFARDGGQGLSPPGINGEMQKWYCRSLGFTAAPSWQEGLDWIVDQLFE